VCTPNTVSIEAQHGLADCSPPVASLDTRFESWPPERPPRAD
jgi:hypothetical protein